VRPILTVSSRQLLHYFADTNILSHTPVPTDTDCSSSPLGSSAASLISLSNELASIVTLLDTSTITKRQTGPGLPGFPAACQSECTGFTEVFNRCLDLDRSGCLQVCSTDGWNNVRLSFCCACLSDSSGDETCSSADTEYPPDLLTNQAASCLNCDLQFEVTSEEVYNELQAAINKLVSRTPRQNLHSLARSIPKAQAFMLIFFVDALGWVFKGRPVQVHHEERRPSAATHPLHFVRFLIPFHPFDSCMTRHIS
jgi:hypothetical protein